MKYVQFALLILTLFLAGCEINEYNPRASDPYATTLLKDSAQLNAVIKMVELKNHTLVTAFVRDARQALSDKNISIDELEVAVTANDPQLREDFPNHEVLFVAVRSDDILFPMLVNDFNRANPASVIERGGRKYFLLF